MKAIAIASVLGSRNTKKGSGVIVGKQVNMNSCFDVMAKRTNIILGFASRGIVRWNRDIISSSYKILGELILKYFIPFWCPIFKIMLKNCR